MDEPYEIIGGNKVFKGRVEFRAEGGATVAVVPQAHVADAKVNYTATNLDAESEIITAFNSTNGTINSILTILETLGFVKSA